MSTLYGRKGGRAWSASRTRDPRRARMRRIRRCVTRLAPASRVTPSPFLLQMMATELAEMMAKVDARARPRPRPPPPALSLLFAGACKATSGRARVGTVGDAVGGTVGRGGGGVAPAVGRRTATPGPHPLCPLHRALRPPPPPLPPV